MLVDRREPRKNMDFLEPMMIGKWIVTGAGFPSSKWDNPGYRDLLSSDTKHLLSRMILQVLVLPKSSSNGGTSKSSKNLPF